MPSTNHQSVSRCGQEKHQGTLSATPLVIQGIAPATSGSGAEVIRHCQLVVTSFHEHYYQHHAGRHLYQQENKISACLLHTLLVDVLEIVCDVTHF